MAARYSELHHVTFLYGKGHMGMLCRCGWHNHITSLVPRSSVLTIPAAHMTAKHFKDAEATLAKAR